MRNPYLKEMNTFMTLHWKDTLEENGFTPIRDSTEWVRLTDNQIMQIILCSGYTLPEISSTRRPCRNTCGAIIAAR